MCNRNYVIPVFFLFLYAIIAGCANSPSSSKEYDNTTRILITGNNYVSIYGDSTKSYTLKVKLDDAVSFEKTLSPNEKVSCLSILKEKKELYNDIALLLARNKGNININLSISATCDTNFVFHVDTNEVYQHKATVIAGICAATTINSESPNAEYDIIRWLYRKNLNNLNDSVINNVRLYLNELNRTSYNEYISNQKIPVVNSLKGIDYKINSDLKADHYYLFACKKEKDIEDFVEEMVSLKFESSVKSLNQIMPCFRSSDTSGLACIFLVGIKKDWSYQIVPIGLICIDNIKPSIGECELLESSEEDNSYFQFENHKIKVISNAQIPVVSGNIDIKLGYFEGRGHYINVPFTFSFRGDVKTIVVHQNKTQSESIDLSDKSSPYHTKINVLLGTGENFIPIDAIDALGNKTSYDLEISTQRIKKEPVIENNIYTK